jgi:hypothetical protein
VRGAKRTGAFATVGEHPMEQKIVTPVATPLAIPATPASRLSRALWLPALLTRLAMARQAVAPRWRRPARRAKAERIPRPWRTSRFVKRFAFFGFLGPGLIAATAGNDVGGVVTYSSDGAQFGYGFLWAMVLITVSMAVVQEMCAAQPSPC